jgi:hypothetical protein
MTVDYDATQDDISYIRQYLEACKKHLQAGPYTLSLYASGFVLTECEDLILHSWLAMSRGWRGPHTPGRFDIYQYPGLIAGTDLDISNGAAGGWRR